MNKYSKDEHRYDDIVNLPYPYPTCRKRMSMTNRGAQFAPFAALTGHDKAINETARLTNQKVELSEEQVSKINIRLNIIQSLLPSSREVSITYFEPDLKKEGGTYITKSCFIKKIDEYERKVIMTDHSYININNIYSIDGDLFNEFF